MEEEIRKTISSWSLEQVSQRLGSALAALVFVNVIGALFAIAPIFLGSIAILVGSLWPTWVRDLYTQIRKRILFIDEEDEEDKDKEE